MRAGLFACAIGTVLLSATPPLAAQNTGADVSIESFAFRPARMTVKAGTTVTWTNRDDIPHTVTAKDRAFRSKAMDTDDVFSFTFSTPGEYQYFCTLHPHMTGNIVVEATTGGGTTR
jgi:plastocyanin